MDAETTDSNGKKQIACPNCGSPAKLDQVLCHNCGLNLKTGESFDEKMSRAKQRRAHPERYQRGIFLGAVIAFSLFMFAGFMYQRNVEKALQKEPQYYWEFVRELNDVDRLIEGRRTEEARKRCQALITHLEWEQSAIVTEVAYGTSRQEQVKREEKPYLSTKKRFLQNLLEKARLKLRTIS